MTELRKRMIESLQLRGMSERTQEAYVRAVRQLAQHYKKSPDLISEEELRQYFLYIKNVKKYSRAASTIAICGIKFFYEKTLDREFTALNYGLLAAGNRHLLDLARELLGARPTLSSENGNCNRAENHCDAPCASELTLIGKLSAKQREPPW